MLEPTRKRYILLTNTTTTKEIYLKDRVITYIPFIDLVPFIIPLKSANDLLYSCFISDNILFFHYILKKKNNQRAFQFTISNRIYHGNLCPIKFANHMYKCCNAVDLYLPFYFHMKDHLRLGNPHIPLILYCSNTILSINQLSCFCCINARKQEKKHDYEN